MQVNDVKDIYNHSISGKPVFEGKAKLRKHWATEQGMEYWEVQFISDNHVADRWIKRETYLADGRKGYYDPNGKEVLDDFFSKLNI